MQFYIKCRDNAETITSLLKKFRQENLLARHKQILIHMILTILAKLEIPLCKFDDSKFQWNGNERTSAATYPAGFWYRGCGIGAQTLVPKKKNKKQKNKNLLELKMTTKCLKCLSTNIEVLNSKVFGPLLPSMGRRASRDTKTSDFRYKRYPPKISGYVTVQLTFPA